MFRKQIDLNINKAVYFTATLWSIWCSRNDITFNNNKCNTREILENIERDYKSEITAIEKENAGQTRNLEGDPIVPPDFERFKDIDEPPGFERRQHNNNTIIQHLIGNQNDHERTVINTYGEYKSGNTGVLNWNFEGLEECGGPIESTAVARNKKI